MDSLECRIKQLEDKILSSDTHLNEQTNICDQLGQSAKLYGKFIEDYGEFYSKFTELRKNLSASEEVQKIPKDVKVDLVLSFEDDLIRHFNTMKLMAEKADKVLDIKEWPDVCRLDLTKLETTTRDQHLQSVSLDKQTDELLDVYNDIIKSFKNNIRLWNEKLEAYENEERKSDED